MLISSMNDSSEHKILKELQKINQDLKNTIEATEIRLLVKFGSQNKKISDLEETNNLLKKQLEVLEQDNRNTKVLIFGLKRSLPRPSKEQICLQLKDLVKENVSSSDIKNLYYLGKSEKDPLKIEFLSYWKKVEFLKYNALLKGSGVRICEDLTRNQREELKALKELLIQEKQKGIYKKCFIRHNKLVLDNEAYTYKEFVKLQEKKRQNRNGKDLLNVQEKQNEHTHIKEIANKRETQNQITNSKKFMNKSENQNENTNGCRNFIKMQEQEVEKQQKIRKIPGSCSVNLPLQRKPDKEQLEKCHLHQYAHLEAPLCPKQHLVNVDLSNESGYKIKKSKTSSHCRYDSLKDDRQRLFQLFRDFLDDFHRRFSF